VLGVSGLLIAILVVTIGFLWSPTGSEPQNSAASGAPAQAGPGPVAITTSEPSAVKPSAELGPQQPGTLRLPAGGTAKLVRQQLGPDSSLPIPENLGEAAWWGADLAAASGASVFAGHVNWGGHTGPFAELWSTKVDSPITIVDSAGKSYQYRISQVMTLDKNELPQRADALFSQAGKHRVVLVTCGGEWVGGSLGYNENRVIVADPV